MQEGSRLKVDYEITWDKDGFFVNQRSSTRSHMQERVVHRPLSAQHARNEATRDHSQIIHSISDGSRTKRFRVGSQTIFGRKL